jgi:ABC-type sugar transport system permease subunit
MGFSLFALLIFIKSKNRVFFASVFMVITLLPSSVLLASWLHFLSEDGFWGRGIEASLGVEVINLLATHPFFYYPFFVFMSSIPWIGLHGLTFYFLVRWVPNSVYDMAKMDGMNKISIFFKIIFPLAEKGLPITIFASLITSFRVYEPFRVFHVITGKDAGNAYIQWANLMIRGEVDVFHPNSLIVILTGLTFVGLSFLGLFLLKSMKLKIKDG